MDITGSYTFNAPPDRVWDLLMNTDNIAACLPGCRKLEPIGDNRTRLTFDERYNIAKAPFKWFEGPIYKFINKQNEQSMQRVSDYLTAHPEYRADLVAGNTGGAQ